MTMEKLEATFRVVTPLFLGGADPRDHAELREPSIKAALRFWWRAIKWAHVRTQAADDNQAIDELRKQEAVLFGSAAKGYGQGSFQLRIQRSTAPKYLKSSVVYNDVAPQGTNRPGARYLGYGAMVPAGERAGQLTRAVIEKSQEFTLELRACKIVPSEVIDALKLLGLLGGVGSKARKGYGSLVLISLSGYGADDWKRPTNVSSYVAQVQACLTPARGLTNPPPFSAFFDGACVCLLLTGDDPLTVLDRYGRQMQRYRSWGYHGNVNGVRREENFPDDHGWCHGTRPSGFHPRRVIFGLPHNYGNFPTVQISAEHHDRRASPLWFHVHDFGDGVNPRYAGIATVFRAQFLPVSERINAGGTLVSANPKYNVILDFLDGYEGPAGAKTSTPYFPASSQVFP
jgi:CRISPR-associated protein Cmr1